MKRWIPVAFFVIGVASSGSAAAQGAFGGPACDGAPGTACCSGVRGKNTNVTVTVPLAMQNIDPQQVERVFVECRFLTPDGKALQSVGLSHGVTLIDPKTGRPEKEKLVLETGYCLPENAPSPPKKWRCKLQLVLAGTGSGFGMPITDAASCASSSHPGCKTASGSAFVHTLEGDIPPPSSPPSRPKASLAQ